MATHRPVMTLRFALALCGGAATSCWVPQGVGEVMQSDIRQLKADLQEAEQDLDTQRATLQEESRSTEDRLADLEESLEQLQRASGQTVAGLDVKMEEVKAKVQQLQGEIEVLNHELDQVESQVEDMVKRLETVETGLPGGSLAAAPEGADEGDEKEPEGKKELLAYSKRLIGKGKLDGARTALRKIVRKWPDESGITDEAYFRLGDTYFKEKSYRSALQEYIKVVEKFPKGKFADDAYYRIGECSLELGNKEDAKIFFSEIVKNHKKSPLVGAAKKKLRELR